MDNKTLHVLEYDKIRGRLKAFCDFSASMELALALEPTDLLDLALARLAETSEARRLFSIQDIGIGGAHDIRPAVDLAARGGVLDPQQLLDVKSTLISCRELKKSLERKTDEYPHLAQTAAGLPEPHGIVDAITRILSDRGEVLDSASPKLADLRSEIKVAHGRLMSRLQRYLTESANKLQERAQQRTARIRTSSARRGAEDSRGSFRAGGRTCRGIQIRRRKSGRARSDLCEGEVRGGIASQRASIQ
jgi:DNA mismatch repair protein MutS2